MDVIRIALAVCCAAAVRAGFQEDAEALLRSIWLSPARLSQLPTVLRDVEAVLSPVYPGSKVHVCGSVAADLAIVRSDIDVTVSFPAEDPAARRPRDQLALHAKDVLFQHPELFQVIDLVPEANPPVLSSVHVPSGFEVDLSFNNRMVVQKASLLKHLMALDDRARDLTLLLKHWSKLRAVANRTMLPSVAVVTLSIFYLQQRAILPAVATLQRNTPPLHVNHWNMNFTKTQFRNDNNDTLCALLGGFFEYYSGFDYDRFVISPFAGYPVPVHLFEDWTAVPAEFELYRDNVRFNRTAPLKLQAPIIQHAFEHNLNLAKRLGNQPRRLQYQHAIDAAAGAYEDGCEGFLDAILS